MIVTPVLEKYFKFDKIFNLLSYSEDMLKLREELAQLVRDNYDPEYRFIFLHYDTDYHLGNQPGFILLNLQRILHGLGIPNYFCLVLTQQELSEHLEQLRVRETNDDVSIGVIQHNLQDLLHFQKTTQTLSPERVEKKFICLNRARRNHRTVLFALLRSHNLLDSGLVSYCNRK